MTVGMLSIRIGLGIITKIIHAFDIPVPTKVIKELRIISVLFSI